MCLSLLQRQEQKKKKFSTFFLSQTENLISSERKNVNVFRPFLESNKFEYVGYIVHKC
ncbi:hypothetical protein PGB90_009560 [Kerria lacca]